jgi:hypothetical protein
MSKTPKTPLERCLLYLAKMPAAISGSGGHAAMFAAACTCWQFGLDEGDALAALQSFNETQTGGEPFTERELRHKLADARKTVAKENGFGKFLRDDPTKAPRNTSAPRPAPVTAPTAAKPKRVFPTPEAAKAEALRQAQAEARAKRRDPAAVRFAQSWSYPGDTFRVLRFDFAEIDPDAGKPFKTFRPIHRNGAGWSLGDPPGPLPLYRGDHLPADGPIIVTEGERCADAARSVGLAAVTSAHGSKSPHLADWRPLAGREIIILPDNDDTGREYGRKAAGLLLALNPPAVVKIIDLPGLPEHGDIADWISADGEMGDKGADEIRAAILALAQAAPDWTPTATAPDTMSGKADAPAVVFAPVLTCLADVKPEPVRWLWDQKIALGKTTMFAGRPDLGKSFITLDLAARVSRGDSFPLYPANVAPPGDVVLLSAEDDAADTIVPRLLAAGANLRRIHALTTVQVGVNFETGKPIFAPFNLADHLPMLEDAIRQRTNCRLVVIDPISAYLGKTDSHNNGEVRGLLAPLADLAARYRVAIVAVSHFNKSAGEAINRVMGSLAFVAAGRAAFVFVKDQDDPTGARRFMLPLKNNLSADRAGLAYRLLSPCPGAMPAVAWEAAAVSVEIEDAVSPDDRRRGPEPKAQQEAAAWLRDFLAGGPRLATECTAEAHRQGISPATLRRAKEGCGIVYQNDGFQAPWTWRLPDWENPFEPAAPSVVHPPPVSNNLSNMSNNA